MSVDLFRWPPQAKKFQDIIAPAVESFSCEGRFFDYNRGARKQLTERIMELQMPMEEKLEALHTVLSDLTDPQCADICLSLIPELH